MLLKSEQLIYPNQKLINKLRSQLKSDLLDNGDYQSILCDLILKEKSGDITLETLSDGSLMDVMKEALYKELHRSWMLTKASFPMPNERKTIAEILAWSYEAKSKKQKSVSFYNCRLENFEIEKLAALWEAIKFSQVGSIKGMRGFLKQSPESFKMSCANLAENHLTKFESGSVSYEGITLDSWILFWESIKKSQIETLDLYELQIINQKNFDELWDILCKQLTDSWEPRCKREV